jgi:hypothetical protein
MRDAYCAGEDAGWQGQPIPETENRSEWLRGYEHGARERQEADEYHAGYRVGYRAQETGDQRVALGSREFCRGHHDGWWAAYGSKCTAHLAGQDDDCPITRIHPLGARLRAF